MILKSIPEMIHTFFSLARSLVDRILETLELLRQIYTDSKINHVKSKRKYSTTVVRSIVPRFLPLVGARSLIDVRFLTSSSSGVNTMNAYEFIIFFVWPRQR